MGAEETPVGEWSVTRIRTPAHGTSHSGALHVLNAGGTKGLAGSGESIPRQLVLTKSSLVERRKNNYEVSFPLALICVPFYCTSMKLGYFSPLDVQPPLLSSLLKPKFCVLFAIEHCLILSVHCNFVGKCFLNLDL